MRVLDQPSRQLLVMAALAAINHGLNSEAQILLDAFPWLISAEEPRRVCQALVLLGLAQPEQALACLSDLSGEAAQTLRTLITVSSLQDIEQSARVINTHHTMIIG